MRITITVAPRSRRTAVEPLPDGGFRVSVTAPAHEGRANAAVIDALADYFGVRRASVRILVGRTARRKVVEIKGRV